MADGSTKPDEICGMLSTRSGRPCTRPAGPGGGPCKYHGGAAPGELCGRRSKSTGKPCTGPMGPGGTPCRMHGGAAPAVRRAGERRQAEAEARALLARLDVDPVEDPFTALAKLAGQVTAWKDQMAKRVNTLNEIRYEASGAGTEQLRSEVLLFERAMDRCAAVLGMIAKLNIDDRLARIDERRTDAVVRAVDAGIAAAGITGPAALEVRKVVARHLREVA